MGNLRPPTCLDSGAAGDFVLVVAGCLPLLDADTLDDVADLVDGGEAVSLARL